MLKYEYGYKSSTESPNTYKLYAENLFNYGEGYMYSLNCNLFATLIDDTKLDGATFLETPIETLILLSLIHSANRGEI